MLNFAEQYLLGQTQNPKTNWTAVFHGKFLHPHVFVWQLFLGIICKRGQRPPGYRREFVYFRLATGREKDSGRLGAPECGVLPGAPSKRIGVGHGGWPGFWASDQ